MKVIYDGVRCKSRKFSHLKYVVAGCKFTVHQFKFQFNSRRGIVPCAWEYVICTMSEVINLYHE
jgi:hypothetical protein